MSQGLDTPVEAHAAPPDSEPSLVGTIVAERYRVLERLGEGGMGAVYRVEHVHMKKTLALKVLHRDVAHAGEVRARFEREAIAAGRIEHDNVAGATDFGTLDDGSFYLVLEHVAGRSLESEIEGGAMPEARALIIAGQIADALAAAHGVGVVHRDLKPANVMLVERDDSPDFVKILDFGIAKVRVGEKSDAGSDGAAAPQITRVGSVFGTPEYMSPEQAMGSAVDHRADLYALGVVLYQMLAGHLPFESDDIVALLTRHMTMPPPPLSEGVSTKTRELVMKLLEKDPDQRPQTATDVVAAIHDALAALPSPARASIAAPVSHAAVSGTADTLPEAPAPQRDRRLLLLGAAGAALFVVLGVALLLYVALSPAPPGLMGIGAFDVEVPELAAAEPEPDPNPEPATTPPAAGGATGTSGSAKGATKSQKKPAKAPKKKRKTGPGGIYIPPPSEWF